MPLMDSLIPLSRARPPKEFTLRVTCPPGDQLSLGGPQEGGSFDLGGRQVICSIDKNGSLVLVVRGLPTKEEGRIVFHLLRCAIAYAAVNKRLAIAMPDDVSESEPWGPAFFPNDEKVIAHGWPGGELPIPLAVYNTGAWLYPEHEYVVLLSAISIKPTFLTSLSSITDELSEAAQLPTTRSPLPPEVALAATYFAHAVRSTMAVWSLSLMVTCLEILASRTRVNAETLCEIDRMNAELRTRSLKQEGAVDFEHLENCLRNAKRESISSSVRNLVVSYCAPGVAKKPLTSVFSDEEDCRKKISALYALRSKYSHEGRVSSMNGLKGYSWGELQNVAHQSLKHILNMRMVGE